MLKEYLGVGIFFIVAFLLPFVIFAVSGFLSTKKSTPEKEEVYECGVDTVGETWVRFKTSYFLYALVFVAFDVETVFLYPWAVEFQQLGSFAFVEMFVFIAILVVGFWYAWKEGALEWK